MELVLVRHAEPITEERGDGRPADPPLSERGRRQAREVASWLRRDRIDRVVSSPAKRAQQTALALAEPLGLEIEIDDRLRDANDGADRYVPLEEDKARDPVAYRARVDAYRDSRQLEDIARRVSTSLADWAERGRGERIVVFCHGSVVNVFASEVLGLETRAFLEAEYASAHRFLISSQGIRSVRSLNETAYLGLEADPDRLE